MTPEKAQQLGNDLASLAASIAEIAEEIKSLYDFDSESGCYEKESEEPTPETPQVEPAPESQGPVALTLAEVRGILAEAARAGHSEAIQSIIRKRRVKKLSDLPSEQYPALLEDVRALK